MAKPLVTILGKAVRQAARLRGGGSALPGLFVERIDAHFIADTLADLPYGVVIVSGTNGKTTTTKMVVELLESQGLQVFTNRTGSNFSRGVAAALLGEIDLRGKLSADIAVLELDEAHAVHFVRTVKPRYSLLLNVMRDQLDRFGEIDTTAQMLWQIADATTDRVVVNREDSRLRAFVPRLGDKAVLFGLTPSLRHLFPEDNQMRIAKSGTSSSDLPALGVLESFDEPSAQVTLDGASMSPTLQIEGVYNIYNMVAALTLVKTITADKFDSTKALDRLRAMKPAFGRGEKLSIGGQPLELVLVKNPSGFRLGLQSFQPQGFATMIAINDNYADGRDMSWLWDVEFESLREEGVAYVTGVRAYDMALRLQYDDVAVQAVEPSLTMALQSFITHHPDTPKRIFCTYTAMLSLRKEISKITDVEDIS